MNEKRDVKELKEFLGWVYQVVRAFFVAFEDGKISISDLGEIWGPLKNIKVAMEGMKEMPKEISDLSKEELEELVEHFKVEFDIPQDKVEKVIEDVVVAASKIVGLVFEVFKK